MTMFKRCLKCDNPEDHCTCVADNAFCPRVEHDEDKDTLTFYVQHRTVTKAQVRGDLYLLHDFNTGAVVGFYLSNWSKYAPQETSTSVDSVQSLVKEINERQAKLSHLLLGDPRKSISVPTKA